MLSMLILSLPVAGAAALVFSGFRRRARGQRDLQKLRRRIFGIDSV
jgi:hypothetical protein